MSKYTREERQIQKDADLSNLKKLMGYTRPWAKHIVFAIFLLIAVTASNLLQPILVQRSLDDYLNPNRVSLEVSEDGFEIDGSIYTIGRSAPEAESNFIEVRTEEIDGKKSDKTIINLNGEEQEITGAKLKEINDHRYSKLFSLAIVLLILIILGFVALFLQQNTLSFVGQNVIFNIRSDLFNHLQKLDLEFFERNPTGRLVTRMTNDLENINELYTNVIVTFLSDLGLILGSVFMMFNMNARLAWIALTIVPPLAVLTYIFRTKVRDAFRVVRAKLAQINTSLNENFMGVKTIQIFNQEEKFVDIFSEVNEEHRVASRRMLGLFATFRPAINFLYYVALFLTVLFGGRMAMDGAVKVGVIIAMTMYIDKLFRPIMDLADKFNILQSSLTSIERIFLLFEEEEIVKNKDALPAEKFTGLVEFDDVHFSYIEGEEVLKGVSFTAQPGETIAFVGATGAGKSTIINLISRLYDVDSGEIRIDGKDIKSYDKYQLRERISAVLQDVFLFSGDIRSNIKLLSEDITDEQVYEAAKYVNADKIIDRYQDGLNHEVTEGGTTFSAGERQLLSFARALVHNPDILILDEATASIDTETEELIQEAIEKLVHNRTTFVVAHRLSTIKNADRIIVMHQGKIAEQGTHDELIKAQGLYYDLYRLQYEEMSLSEGNQ